MNLVFIVVVADVHGAVDTVVVVDVVNVDVCGVRSAVYVFAVHVVFDFKVFIVVDVHGVVDVFALHVVVDF